MSSIDNRIPWRHEIKYLCWETQIPIIQNKVHVFCDRDAHGDQEGQYLIRSLYFDDLNDTSYYENEMGTDCRQKYRIRTYNGNGDHLTLERKSKYNGMTWKEGAAFPREFCEDILQGTWICPDLALQPPLLQQFYLEYRTNLLRPKIIVEYRRTPYVYSAGNVRITFDRDISASGDIESFLEPDLFSRPIMPAGQHLLEVKYDTLIPDFIYNAISGERMRQTTFSKYYLCRKIYGGR